MGRCLRKILPQTNDQLIPKWPYLPEFEGLNREYKDQQRNNLNKRQEQPLRCIKDSTMMKNVTNCLCLVVTVTYASHQQRVNKNVIIFSFIHPQSQCRMTVSHL